MNQSRSSTTYMMFAKKGRGITSIVGPFFDYQKNHLISHYFQDKTPYIVEENAFKAQYAKLYVEHLRTYWADKVYCYLKINPWIGGWEGLEQDEMFVSEWFVICSKMVNEKQVIEVMFSIDCNAFNKAKLLYDLKQILPLPIVEGRFYYRGYDNLIYTGSKAVSRFLGEQLTRHMCLT